MTTRKINQNTAARDQFFADFQQGQQRHVQESHATEEDPRARLITTPSAGAAERGPKAFDSSSVPAGVDITTCQIWEPHTSRGAALGIVVYTPPSPAYQGVGDGAPAAPTCRQCHQPGTKPDPLFQPCNCPGQIHRSCFKQSRTGLTSPASYWACPQCLVDYNIVRVKDVPMDTEEDIRRSIRLKVGILWLTIFGILAASISILALIAYGADKREKNIPVAIKACLSSVVFGFPNSNTTTEWRQEFRGSKHVFQYYGILGAIIVSILILLAACLAPEELSKDRDKRRSRSCCDDCCHNDGGSSNWYFCYFGTTGNNGSCDCCDCCCSGDGCCSCFDNGCKLPDGGCSDAGEAAVVIAVIVVVIVLISAIFIVLFFGVRRTAQLQDSLSQTVRNQCEERENCTIVLGINEWSGSPNAV